MSGRRKPHRRSEPRRRVEAERREHLWFSLPVRCWCGATHVLGVDDEDGDFSSADDGDSPIRFDYLNEDDEP